MKNHKTFVFLGALGLLGAAIAAPDAYWRQPGGDVRYVAHQGEEALAPNHTIRAYEFAREHDLDFLKLDIRETKDGVIVTQHDKDLKAVYGTNVVIRETTYREICDNCRVRSSGSRKCANDRICTLDEALAVAVKMKGGAWIDFKSYSTSLVERVFGKVKSSGLGLDRIMVATYTQPALRYVGEKYPSVRRVAHTHIGFDPKTGLYNSNLLKGKTFPAKAEIARALAAEAKKRGLYGLNVPTSIAADRCKTDAEMIRIFHEAGLWISIWFVNTPADGRYYRAAGADAFVTMCAASTERPGAAGGYAFAVPIRGIGGLGGDVTRYPDDPLKALQSVRNRGGSLVEFPFVEDEAAFAARLDVLPREAALIGIDCRAGGADAAVTAAKRIAATRRLHQVFVVGDEAALIAAQKAVPGILVCFAATASETEDQEKLLAVAQRCGGVYVRLLNPCTREFAKRAHQSGIRLILEDAGGESPNRVVRDALIRRGIDFLLTRRLTEHLTAYWAFQKSHPFEAIEDEFRSRSVITAFRVVSPETAKPSEKTAADEIGTYLARRLGAGRLMVEGRTNVVFHVGDTAFAREKGLSSDTLKDEEWVIRSFGGDVVLNGGGTRGTLYAAYHFLEDFCGVRWWSETEEDVPSAGDLTFDRLAAHGRPAFRYRDIYRTMDPAVSTSLLAVRRRLNRNGGVPIPLALGGAIDYGTKHCHTFDRYVPWKTLGKTHPELFSLVDGKRCGGHDYKTGGQLCLSNPEVYARIRAELEKSILESARKARAENREPPRLFEVSMNDNRRFCTCEGCQAETNLYGVSGQYLRFVNRLADDVAKTHPDAYLTTLAYYFTEDAPLGGVRAAENVLVKLCNTRANMARSILTPGENDIMRGLLDVWQKLATNLFVWDYDITFTKDSTGFPFPSEFDYANKFRLYRAHNVRGIFWEQEHPESSDLFDLKYYLKAKVLEDPDCDYDALLKRTFDEYYGPAGGEMYAQRLRLKEAAEKNDAYLSWFPQRNQWNFIRGTDIAFCRAAAARAEARAQGDVRYLRRIRKTMAPFERLASWRDGAIVRHVPGTPDGLPPLAGMPDGAFWEVPVEKFALYGKTNAVIVADASAPWGKAVELNPSVKDYAFPLVAGHYDAKAKKTTFTTKLKFQETAGTDYAWYDVGTVTFTENGYVYLTTGWHVQIHPTVPDLAGRTLAVRALMCRTASGAVRLARMIFAEGNYSKRKETNK